MPRKWRDGEPRLLSGLDPLQRISRYGVWLIAQHQLTGRAEGGKAVSGLSVYLNVTQADRRTSTIDSQVAAGLFYKRPVPEMPNDVLGIGLAGTNVNSRVARGSALASP